MPLKTLAQRFEKIPEWAWVALALLLRWAFVLKLGGRFYQIDESSFSASAWNLASQGLIGAGGRPSISPPIPTAFFALFYSLFGHNPIFPRLAQAAVGAATAWMIGRMTQELSGSRRAGRFALAIAAVYPFFIYYSGMLMSESLYIAVLVPGLWLLCSSLSDGGKDFGRAAAAGLLLGLSALSRTESAPIVAVLWLAALAAALRGRWSARAWLVAVLLWALPIFSWCARNKIAVGRFSLDNHGGVTMLHGTLLFDLNEIDTGVAMKAFAKTALYEESLALDDRQRDRLYMRESLKFMASHPAETARQWTRKLVNFWRFYPRADKKFLKTPSSDPGAGLGRASLVVISLLFEPALILGGLWGLWSLRGRLSALFPIALFALGTMAVHVVSVSQMRYRLPVMPFLIFGIASLAARVNRRSGT